MKGYKGKIKKKITGYLMSLSITHSMANDLHFGKR